MINSINSIQTQQNHNKSKARYLNIKYSGYAALTGLGVCGLTGLKQVRIPKKMQVHKYSAILTAVTSLWHLGAIKRWDNILSKKNK